MKICLFVIALVFARLFRPIWGKKRANAQNCNVFMRRITIPERNKI